MRRWNNNSIVLIIYLLNLQEITSSQTQSLQTSGSAKLKYLLTSSEADGILHKAGICNHGHPKFFGTVENGTK